MANPVIKIKRSSVAGKVPHYPTQIDLGELAINTADGKVFLAAGQSGVGVGTTVIQVGISTQTILSGVATVTTLLATDLSVTNVISGISSGSEKVDVTSDVGNQWHFVGYLDSQTGYQKIKTNGLTYNPNIGKLYAGIGSFTSIELGDTNDTTIARASAGKISVEGVNIVTVSSVDTLSNKTFNDLVVSGISTLGVTSTTRLTSQQLNVSGIVTASGGFVGNLTGNVTGNLTGNVTGNLTGNVNSTGISTISGFTFPTSDGTNGQVLATNGVGQLAFITASAAGSGTTIANLSWTVGVGSTAFQSPHNIAEDTTVVFNNGLKLALNSDYYINSNTIFIKNGPLQENDRVHATIHYDSSFDSEVFTASDQQTSFTLAATILSSQDRAKVYLNGAKLRNEIDYTISQTIVLNLAAESEDLINISSDSGDSYTIASQGQTSFGFTSSAISASNLLVYQNGIRLEPTDYTIGSLSVVLLFPASNGDTIDVLLYS